MSVDSETLENLVAYPVDENGLRIGANVSYTKSHRHWSHLLMVHPLHIMTGEQPAERELLEKSVLHWLTVDGSKGINGWSRAAAASPRNVSPGIRSCTWSSRSASAR